MYDIDDLKQMTVNRIGTIFNNAPPWLRRGIKSGVDPFFNLLKSGEELLHQDAHVIPDIKRSMQIDAYSCGVQSAYIVLNYYGIRCAIDGVEKSLGTRVDDGTGIREIRALWNRKGLVVNINSHATIKDIVCAINNLQPILVCIYPPGNEDGHWAVLYGYSRNSVFILDPSLRRFSCEISKTEFRKIWKNWCAVVRKK